MGVQERGGSRLEIAANRQAERATRCALGSALGGDWQRARQNHLQAVAWQALAGRGRREPAARAVSLGTAATHTLVQLHVLPLRLIGAALSRAATPSRAA